MPEPAEKQDDESAVDIVAEWGHVYKQVFRAADDAKGDGLKRRLNGAGGLAEGVRGEFRDNAYEILKLVAVAGGREARLVEEIDDDVYKMRKRLDRVERAIHDIFTGSALSVAAVLAAKCIEKVTDPEVLELAKALMASVGAMQDAKPPEAKAPATPPAAPAVEAVAAASEAVPA